MKSVFTKKAVLGIIVVLILSLGTNLLTLALPRVSADAINNIFKGNLDLTQFQTTYLGFIIAIMVITILQTVAANIVTESFSADLRKKLINKISNLSYNSVLSISTSRLLTNIVSDVEAVKMFFNQGIVIIFSSLVLLIGASVSMLALNVQLALIVMSTIPLLLITFAIIFRFIGKYFKLSQENLDKLNLVINESIVGAALIRVLNSSRKEVEKFDVLNETARKISLKITFGFASLIPVITILSNLAILAVVYFGGSGVIDFVNSRAASGINPGDYSAFFTYVGTFIMPILMLGFVGSAVARSFASIKRIQETLDAEDISKRGNAKVDLTGDIKFEDVSLELNNRSILNKISFEIKPGTKTAIVGPTAAGKTQIFNLIAGLQLPTAGKILIDGTPIDDIENDNFYAQVALVFQDSVIFNTTIKENILFNIEKADEANLAKAIDTAELSEFITAQPDGVDTMISERGASLSGGQKQRLTLARALAINPKILLLDDFTARVDIRTERNILNNLVKNYPGLTLLSITQKIESIKDYDQILLIMEGELIAKGTHKELLKNSFEYQQIYNSQKSTEAQ